MKKIYLIVITVMTFALLSAQHTGMHRETRGEATRMGRISQHQNCMNDETQTMQDHQCCTKMEHLDLNDEQEQVVENLQHQHRLVLIDLNAELKKLALTRTKQLGEADFRNAKRTSDQYHAKRAEIAKKRIELMENIYKELNSEQQKRFKNSEMRIPHGRQRSMR